MDRIRKCTNCGKSLDYFEGGQIPFSVAASAAYPMPSAGTDLYCDNCLKDATGESTLAAMKEDAEGVKKRVIEVEKLRDNESMISDANGDATVLGVTDAVSSKEISKGDRKLLLYSCNLHDASGKIEFIMWNEAIVPDAFYRVTGHVQDFKGKRQITKGYGGRVERISSNA